MPNHRNQLEKPLPPPWPRRFRSAILHVISLARYAVAHTGGWAVNSPIAQHRLKAGNDELIQEVALLENGWIYSARSFITGLKERSITGVRYCDVVTNSKSGSAITIGYEAN